MTHHLFARRVRSANHSRKNMGQKGRPLAFRSRPVQSMGDIVTEVTA